jgi:hypothetical protein
VAGLGACVVVRSELLEAVLYTAFMFTTAGLAWAGARRAPSGTGPVPALLAVGLTATALGDLAWFLYVAAGQEPYVSLADALYLAGYLGLGAALSTALVGAGQTRRVNADVLVDALSVMVVSVLVFWTFSAFSVRTVLTDDTLTPLAKGVASAYPVLDACLLARLRRDLPAAVARCRRGHPQRGG